MYANCCSDFVSYALAEHACVHVRTGVRADRSPLHQRGTVLLKSGSGVAGCRYTPLNKVTGYTLPPVDNAALQAPKAARFSLLLSKHAPMERNTPRMSGRRAHRILQASTWRTSTTKYSHPSKRSLSHAFVSAHPYRSQCPPHASPPEPNPCRLPPPALIDAAPCLGHSLFAGALMQDLARKFNCALWRIVVSGLRPGRFVSSLPFAS
jgi:hypothetical protein